MSWHLNHARAIPRVVQHRNATECIMPSSHKNYLDVKDAKDYNQYFQFFSHHEDININFMSPFDLR